MTNENEQKVWARWPDACVTRVLSSPDSKRVGKFIIEREWKAGDELGIGDSPALAWADAASRLESGEGQ